MTVNVISQTQTVPTITIETKIETALEEVRVNMAELKAENQPINLVTSVGSCIAICIHDSMNMCGGLAHIMLPNSSIAPREPLPAKFADTAVPELIRVIKRLGGNEKRLYAKIAGGANMFPNMNALNIGAKNIEATKVALQKHKVRLVSEDVGGENGRRITFNIATGVALVKRFNGAVAKI
ncbi:MAG: chemotaxis protein CheD [Crenarchaeota archaeon]|nr:chemotaxis protein CheD [Thermoproteota archaeon]